MPKPSVAPTPARVEVLGLPIDPVDTAGSVERCLELVRGGTIGNCQVSLNAGKVVECAQNPEMAAFVRRCALINADGQSVVWASRLLGRPVPERVAGIDLMHALLAAAEREGLRVFVLGARQEVLDQALVKLAERYPALVIAGSRNGYFSEDEEPSVVAQVREAQPDILFIAITSPRKEMFLSRYREELAVPFSMGVGGAIDVIAGLTPRAPLWMRRAGLEWFWRLAQEPRRLWRRYLLGNARFVRMVAAELVRVKLLRRAAPAPPRP